MGGRFTGKYTNNASLIQPIKQERDCEGPVARTSQSHYDVIQWFMAIDTAASEMHRAL